LIFLSIIEVTYLKDPLEEMQGNCRLKEGGSEALVRKDPEGCKASKKSRSVQQKHASFARQLDLLFCRGISIPKL